MAVDKANGANGPKDTIDRASQRGAERFPARIWLVLRLSRVGARRLFRRDPLRPTKNNLVSTVKREKKLKLSEKTQRVFSPKTQAPGGFWASFSKLNANSNF